MSDARFDEWPARKNEESQDHLGKQSDPARAKRLRPGYQTKINGLLRKSHDPALSGYQQVQRLGIFARREGSTLAVPRDQITFGGGPQRIRE